MAVQMLANPCHTARETGQVSMTWLAPGELAHASMIRAVMRLCSTSADVPQEGLDREPAMQQAPCCDAALSVQRSSSVQLSTCGPNPCCQAVSVPRS